MCIIVAKKFPGIGWVGAKLRDRGYIPLIEIIQSNRRSIQRLYLSDSESKYTEGLNEFGVCIISASLAVKDDEKEIIVAQKMKKYDATYMSPDGKKIRDALYEKTPKAALKHLIDEKLSGNTLIFNKDECWVLEAGVVMEYEENPDAKNEEDILIRKKSDFIYKFKQIKDDYVVRTNHGILLPQFGYQKDDKSPDKKRSYKSSLIRFKYATEAIENTRIPDDLLDTLSERKNEKGPDIEYMNMVRTGNIKNHEMVTTGMIQLIASECTMHYKPIFSDVKFSYTKLNSENSKTFFEVVSNRRLLGFKEFLKSH